MNHWGRGQGIKNPSDRVMNEWFREIRVMMKKILMVLLIALMTVSLLGGCSDNGKSASSKKSQSEENSDEDDDEEYDEDEDEDEEYDEDDDEEDDEKETVSKKKKKSSKKKDSSKKKGTPLYQKICGRYCYEYDDEDEMGETYPLEILNFGGNLYAFGGSSMDSFDADHIESYTFWAMELIPEQKEDLFATDTDECTFGVLTFSIMSNVGKYWNEPDMITVKVTDEGLEISGMPSVGESPALFKKNDHIERTFGYMNEEPVDEKMDKDLIGIWQLTDSDVPLYVEFSENNNIRIYRKDPLLEVLYRGGSFSEIGKDSIICTVSSLGSGGMPSEFIINYGIDGEKMTLQFDELYDSFGDDIEPLKELIFKKVDLEDIPVITLDDIEDIEYINIYEDTYDEG